MAAPEFKHLAIIKFKEGVVVDDIIKGMEKLVSQISLIKSLEWGQDLEGHEMLTQGFTHAFTLTFKSKEDYIAYEAHPNHLEYAAGFSASIEKCVVLNYPAVLLKQRFEWEQMGRLWLSLPFLTLFSFGSILNHGFPAKFAEHKKLFSISKSKPLMSLTQKTRSMNKMSMNNNLILLLNLLHLLLQLNSISAFIIPPQSILLFNCSTTSPLNNTTHLLQNCSTELKARAAAGSGSCLVVTEFDKLSEMGLHPLDVLGCSHYLLLRRSRRVSLLEVPDRVKNLCNEWDKVVYGAGRKMGASGGILVAVCFIVLWLLTI
ncbi:Stress-response A/B barrel domain-containing protein At5g22580 [Linum grandiflorum]